MRFLVVGAGSVGGYVGGRLAADGNEVMFMERGPVRGVLAASGLRIESRSNTLQIKNPDTYLSPESAGFFDFVLVCVRVPETESIIEPVRPLLAHDCAVISLQSGIDAMYRLMEAFGERHVMPGYVRVALDSRYPAVIHELEPAPSLAVGEFDGRGSWRLECVQIAFESAGFTVSSGDLIVVDQWRNFLLEAAVASTATQTGLGIRPLLQKAEHRARVCELIAEGIAIAAAEGIALEDTPETLLSFIEGGADEIWLHMRRDLAAGRSIENEALAGSLQRRARKLAIPAPSWARLYEELKNRAPSRSPGRAFPIPPVRAG